MTHTQTGPEVTSEGTTNVTSDAHGRYRGPDRRPSLTAVTDARSWTGAGLGLVGLTTAVMLLALDAGIRDALLPLTTHLRVAALALTAVFAAAALGLWRVTGEVRGCRVATAAWLLTAVVALDLADPAVGSTLELLRTSLGAVAAGWLLWAAAGPDVDTEVRSFRDVGIAAAAALGLWVVLTGLLAVPGVSRDAAVVVVAVIVVAWWASVAVGTVARSLGTRSYLLGWVGWATLGLAVAEGTRYLHTSGVMAAGFPSAAVRLAAVVLAAVGTVTALVAAATGRRGELYRAMQQERRREEERRTEEAERDHEVRNALLAIEGATLTLQRHREHLPHEVQEELTSTVVNQLAGLREMMVTGHRAEAAVREATREAARRETARSEAGRGGPLEGAGPPVEVAPVDGDGAGATGSFRLTEIVREQVGLARARDLAVELELATDTDAEIRGDRSAISRVVSNLLRNAEVHGAGDLGSRIDVEVRRDGDRLRLVVRDHGLGVPPGEEESIFGRCVQLSSEAPGDGLGLFIAQRTMRELGGDLRHEHPAGGGARFVATFPAAVGGDGAEARESEAPRDRGSLPDRSRPGS